MTIDKAITLIEHCAKTHAHYDRVEVKDALKLGVEALKRVKDMRISPCTTADEILPGETEE